MPRGKLYLVATPIGNLEDITLRALRVLKEVDLIACEDTRHTAKLLAHYGISTPRESYHEHNESSRTPQLLALLQNGKNIALVCDAGTPLISDPGLTLVRSCHQAGIEVLPIPGPNAAVAALSGSGLSTDAFFFAGFLPARSAARKKRLQELATMPATLVFHEAPHRLLATLEDMLAILGPRPACSVRELTKMHEEWLRGSLAEILEALRKRSKIQGEITLMVSGSSGGATQARSWPASIRRHVEEEMRKTGASRKEALRSVALQRGISRNQAYKQLLGEN